MKKEAKIIWKMDLKEKPLKEDILKGYLGSLGRTQLLEDISSKYRKKEVLLPSGAQVIFISSKSNYSSKVLIAFHGGPESYEGTEIRYLGLYRQLLKKNWTIAILNYRGGLNTAKDNHLTTWGKWKKSIFIDYTELITVLGKKDIARNQYLLGVSFGASLAILISQKFKVEKVVLFSPLLDLSSQIKRAGSEYYNWFRQRFSSKDIKDFSLKNLSNVDCSMLIFFSDKDEVLDRKINHEYFKLLKKRNADVTCHFQNCSHYPKIFTAAYFRYRNALLWLLG